MGKYKYMNSFERITRRERPGEKLDGLMSAIADRLNQELPSSNDGALVKNDCSINMEAFGKEDVEEDKKKIWEKEVEWSAAQNPNVQDFYKEKYGAQGVEGVVAEFRKEKERGASGQLEKAITGVFYKILRSEYVVVRSSAFDDYFNGLDNVIVNKKTGDVVCAFDEVHGEAGQERHDKKLDKVKKIACRGGAALKYGLSFEGGSPVKKSLANIPVFYLALSNMELKELLGQMSYGVEDKPGETELKVFDKLVALMEEQAKILGQEHLPPAVRVNLDKFRQGASRMKELRAAIE